jgi:predicted DNA-binding transcriptional regulator AlpA
MAHMSSTTAPHVAPLFLSDRQVAHRLGCSRASVWRAVHSDIDFPKPVRLIGRRVGWWNSEIDEWAAGRERAH